MKANVPRNVRKKQIIAAVAEKTGMTTAYTRQVVERFMSEMISELAHGNDLEFRGFGNFRVVTRKKKIARNPKTGTVITVPPHRVVRFRQGKEVKELLNS
ncbi:MAG: HU family DNA-binding protein [Planctomycetota bacterium]